MANRREAPIGIFDSGAGGLTVLKEIRARMPREKLVYFGDTGNLPYGSKSKKAIVRASLVGARFLAEKGIKALVIACNTASSMALPEITREMHPIPVLGVITPAARAAAQAGLDSPRPRLGVIGTQATVFSGSYVKAIKRLMPRAIVIAAACPLFVPLVEEGWWRGEVSEIVARRYLRPFLRPRAQALILGCTHYPMLKPTIRRVLGPRTMLIDSGEETARDLEKLLQSRDLARLRGPGTQSFFVSDAPERFWALARRFLGRGVRQVHLQIFGQD